MKFSGEVIINQPKELVAKLFVDPQFMGEYQDGFLRKELVSGETSKVNSVSKIYYQYGKRDMELTETITANKLPNTFEAFYHHEHMDNTMKCTFTSVDGATTKYEYEFEYVAVRGLMPKLMMKFFPSMFKKPAATRMKQFKEFVEAFNG
jgi:hypothetical protein